LLGIFILGITLSIDSVFVGISYGIKGTKIPLMSLAVILIFSVFYAGVSILFGSWLKTLMSIEAVKIVGAVILSALGSNMIAKAFKKEKAEEGKKQGDGVLKSLDPGVQVFKNSKVGDVDNSGVIDIREAFLLTLALSVDALVAGIAGGILSLSVWLFPLTTGVLQTLFLCSGIILGNIMKGKIKLHDKYISVFAGIAIIAFSFLKLL
jgi:putative sporulation protein YtaF